MCLLPFQTRHWLAACCERESRLLPHALRPMRPRNWVLLEMVDFYWVPCGPRQKLGYIKSVHNITKLLCNEILKHVDSVKNKDGNFLTETGEIRSRWKEHFNVVLKRSDPIYLPETFENLIELDINTDRLAQVGIE